MEVPVMANPLLYLSARLQACAAALVLTMALRLAAILAGRALTPPG